MDVWQQPLTVAVVFLLAGVVKGVTGMGLPTVAMSLLGLWMPPAAAAALLVLPSLLTNIAQCRGPHLRAVARRLWPGWVALVVITAAAPGFGGSVPEAALQRGLGLLLIAYGAWGLRRPTLPDLSRRSTAWSAVAGAATGAVTAATGVFVVPWVPYLQALRLDKDALVQALGLSFTLATLALALRVHAALPWSAWSSSWALTACLAVVAACAGVRGGEALRGRLAGATFQRLLFGTFVALGLANLVTTP